LAASLGKTYQELTTGKPGLGEIDGICEVYWWQAYERTIEPLGNHSLQTAQLLTMLFNVNRAPHIKAAQPLDFLPIKKQESDISSHQFAAMFGAKTNT
jgi:hypothetical protein